MRLWGQRFVNHVMHHLPKGVVKDVDADHHEISAREMRWVKNVMYLCIHVHSCHRPRSLLPVRTLTAPELPAQLAVDLQEDLLGHGIELVLPRNGFLYDYLTGHRVLDIAQLLDCAVSRYTKVTRGQT